ncbi:MAG: outer membrane protein assembly factor BamA [Deltaproteobacteria bacterium]|nr:MAG: outer membrane protein assembly factor BamA [Deltaproteobacteria bacterium]
MKFRLLLILLMFLSWPGPLYSQTTRVAVIPLTIYSEEDLSALSKPLMDMLIKGLKQQGFQPVPASGAVEKETKAKYLDIHDGQARAIGAVLGCRFVIYGSLSKIGEQISFDVRLVDVDTVRTTVPIFVTQAGLENLASAVADLTREVGIRIFKKKKIHEIQVVGNRRIEDEAIKLTIKTKNGDVFDPVKLRDDLTAIYKMGYFKDVRVEAEDTPQGQIVSFVVEEKETIGKVVIKGADAIKEEDIRAAISTKKFSILQQSTIKGDVAKILSLYKDKGYYGAEVSYEVKPLKENSVIVTFQIDENKKLYIREITFSGNKHYSDDDLMDEITTAEKDFFFFFNESGILKREKLEVDVDRLAAFYHNHGFVDAKVGSPVITYDEEGIQIDFPIVEGERFRVGKVELTGDRIPQDEGMVGSLRLATEDYFNREKLARDLEMITSFYTSQGYAFAQVVPRISKDPSRQIVDVDYEVQKGLPVNFGRITISGNTKTRDKVIRRELAVIEGGRFNRGRLERSVQNLRRLDFFEQVELDTSKGNKPDQMNINVNVKEKPTRFMSLGGGFSSADSVFAMAQIAERNLFGRGQNLQFQGQFGGVASRFSLSFTEPWLFDIPLSASVEGYSWFRDYDEFDKESIGASLGLGYPVWDYTRLFLSYAYDDSTVSNVAQNASIYIRSQEGNIVSSIVSSTLRRDSRDHPFMTTRGSDNSVTVSVAGGILGGDAGYVKTIVNSGWYFPLFWKLVGFLHGKFGYIDQLGDGIIPIYERFYLGGINSLRAFDSGDVSPRDPVTGDRIGGDKMVLFNVELLFPVVESQGIRGVVFYDMGNSYLDFQDISFDSMKKDAGVGVRWYSPMGPLRLEWGYNLDQQPGEPKSNFQFSMGVFF